MKCRNANKKAGIENFWGGILCLLVMLCLVQGMIFTQGNVKETGTYRNVQTKKQIVTEADGEKGKKVAYLTFDDGPSILTVEYLKILKEEGVHATFFLIGQQLDGELTDIVKSAIKDGHEIGIHTYCHQAEQIYASEQSYCEDLEKTKLCIEEKLQVTPKFFRFPWGSANAYVKNYKSGVIEYMKAEGIDYVDWNVSGEDSVGCPSADSILLNVRKDYKKYDEPVILLHDSATCRQTLCALQEMIHELKEAGYSFGTLSERKNSCHFGE